jgi:hypothetical protein
MQKVYPTEGQLLLSCLGVEDDDASSELLKQLSDCEWERVVQQAITHGVAPLLYRRLETLSVKTVIPTLITQRLRDAALQYAVKNLQLYRELSQVLQVLQRECIPVVVLKGAHLAEIVYGNKALRPMEDLDLLVKKTDLLKAEKALLRLGYIYSIRPHLEIDYAIHHHLCPLINSDASKVELHWSIERPTAPFNIDVDGLWERAQPLIVAGVETLALSPEDLLLHLCLHASFDHHFSFGLRAIYDIERTIEHYRNEIDWLQVRNRALQWGIEKYVYLTFQLVKEFLATAIPETVLTPLQPKDFNPQLIAWARTLLFAEESASPSLSANLAQMASPHRFQGKTAVFLNSVFPSPKVMARMYPVPRDSKRIYLYYPLRWRDLILHYGYSAWRLLIQSEDMKTLADRENQKTALRNWLASGR